jgi:hypothetical protein
MTTETTGKTLHVQLQPGRVAGFDRLDAIDRIRRLGEEFGRGTRLSEGDDGGQFINIDIDADNVAAIWLHLRTELQKNDALANCSIVCCQGQAGWDDYLLLHHFDPDESLDELVER